MSGQLLVLRIICLLGLSLSIVSTASSLRTKKIGNETLLLNGVGIHRKYGFRVYEISLFLKQRTRLSSKILKSKNIKFARMKFLRSLKAKQIRDGFHRAYQNNCAQQCERLRRYLVRLERAAPDMKSGSSFEFVFKKNSVSLKVQGRGEIVIPSGEFGRILLLSWIGPDPPSKRFKMGVLGKL
jgi:hypothetical protein